MPKVILESKASTPALQACSQATLNFLLLTLTIYLLIDIYFVLCHGSTKLLYAIAIKVGQIPRHPGGASTGGPPPWPGGVGVGQGVVPSA